MAELISNVESCTSTTEVVSKHHHSAGRNLTPRGNPLRTHQYARLVIATKAAGLTRRSSTDLRLHRQAEVVCAGTLVAGAVALEVVAVVPPVDDVVFCTVACTTWPSALKMMSTKLPSGLYS